MAKDHAEEMLKLLVSYHDISASEAAMRIGIHIKTAQDFLENLTEAGFLIAQTVFEKKRPYSRYALPSPILSIELDLRSLLDQSNQIIRMENFIRENRDAQVHFTFARNHQAISTVTLWRGKGRHRDEKKLSLTLPQGRFLYHLPFPTAPHEPVSKIMMLAEIGPEYQSEIMDLLGLMTTYHAIEIKKEEK